MLIYFLVYSFFICAFLFLGALFVRLNNAKGAIGTEEIFFILLTALVWPVTLVTLVAYLFFVLVVVAVSITSKLAFNRIKDNDFLKKVTSYLDQVIH